MHGSTGAREREWRRSNERAGKDCLPPGHTHRVRGKGGGSPGQGVRLGARPTLSMLVVIMGCDGDKRKVGHRCTLRVISAAGAVLRWTLDV